MIGFLLAILGCFVIGDLLHRFGTTAEISRKAVHVSSCLVIAAFPWFGTSDYWQGQVQMLQEQLEAMQEPPLVA